MKRLPAEMTEKQMEQRRKDYGIRDLYEAGRSQRQVAEIFGLSQPAICKALRRATRATSRV